MQLLRSIPFFVKKYQFNFMGTKTSILFLSFLLFICFQSQAQTISARILDSISKEPIPFATIQFADESGVISNTEGKFSALLTDKNKPTDSLFISSMGFKGFATIIGNFKDSIVLLSPQNIELKNVIVTNKNYTADEIIDFVKNNLEKNYNTSLTKKRLFFRDHYHQYINRTNYTDFKSTIDAFDKDFVENFLNSVPRTYDYYTETLADLTGNLSKEKQKIKLIKASKMYDKNTVVDFDILEKKLNKLLTENVKPDSYLKIKSGLFGTKIDNEELFGKQVDSTDVNALNKKMEEEKKRKENETLYFANSRKNRISNLFKDLIFIEDTELNFISKSKKYNFTLKELDYLGADVVYVLNFEPKKGADYKGTLYINADDFAVLRADYENVKSLKSFKLLGIFSNEYLAKGKMIFYKDANKRYNLRYIEKEAGTIGGAKRPLKIIEFNKVVKGKNRQNELSLEFDFAVTNVTKYEIVVYDTQEINNSYFETIKEDNTITPTYLSRYDSEFWKGYNIIEPNIAIRTFTATEEKTE
jgi:hypothetical protein